MYELGKNDNYNIMVIKYNKIIGDDWPNFIKSLSTITTKRWKYIKEQINIIKFKKCGQICETKVIRGKLQKIKCFRPIVQ